MTNWRLLPQSTSTHTNKHFISRMISKTKPTAVTANVSVNCFRVRKHPAHNLQATREALVDWKQGASAPARRLQGGPAGLFLAAAGVLQIWWFA